MADDASATNPATVRQLELSEKVVARDVIVEDTVLNIGGSEVKSSELHNGGTKEEIGSEAHILEIESKIHRLPADLRRFGTEREYLAPRTVALGPYYHGKPELRAMEKIKRVAVDSFFEEWATRSRDTAYEMFKPIAYNVRGCYADIDVLEGIPVDEFVSMMFVDGCFLVLVLRHIIEYGESTTARLRSIIDLHFHGIARDMMLLENQIPWPVIEFFMALLRDPLPIENIMHFLTERFSIRNTQKILSIDLGESYKPAHFLSLAQFYLTMPDEEHKPLMAPLEYMQFVTSAAELDEMGIKLEASSSMQFSLMTATEGCLFPKISLPPLSLDSVSACWLVNMAAFEICRGGNDCGMINSYLCTLAVLMNQEEDVRELRAKGIVHGFFSDQQILEFVSGLAPDLRPGEAYSLLMFKLAAYRYKKRVWIAIYRFFYNNAKTIATVLPIISVLVGIFKALLSLKQKQQYQ